MRESFYFYEDAQELVNDFVKDYEGNCYVEEGSASCSSFPCPQELDTWGGETSAIYVYDEDSNEELLSVAYWTDKASEVEWLKSQENEE